MKTFKRMFSAFLTLLLVFSLSACGGDKPSFETCETDYLAGGSDKQISLFGDLKGKKLRVGDSVAMDKWEEDFYKQLEETTGMKVEIEPLESAELNAKIAQAVASGDTRNYFDVAVVVNSTILNMIYANLIVPMDNYIDRDDPVWKYSYADTDIIAPDVYKIDGFIF